MANFKAKLRVVGIYFNKFIEFDDGGNPVTIETLHNEAMSQFPIGTSGGIFFTGSFEQPDGSRAKPNPIRAVSHNYPGRYDFNANGSLEDSVDGLTLGGNDRTKGIYELSEQLIDKGLLAWQYYVIRDAELISTTPPNRGFNPYQGFILKTGDEVIWRLVSIATSPLAQSYRELRLSI